MTGQTFDLQAVLDAVMMEESEPSQEALARWSQRYPQFRVQLADFFNAWASLNRMQGEPDDIAIDEQKIVDKTVKYAMDVFEQQGRILPDLSAQPIGDFEQIVLAAIFVLHGNAYSVTIADKVEEITGQQPSAGSLFLALDRLEERYLVSVREVESGDNREGNTRNYYTVTLSGERALALARETSRAVADFLGDFA